MTFPFSAVVGQDRAKAALQLAAVDPLIGGVLLRGEKGSAKTTLARGLAALLGAAPFVDLPLGTTEDRLIGSLDLGAALNGGELVFRPGLLAGAHGGVLYIDEVNLLADHLVDTLLDVAVSGVNRVERDGITHSHPARFVLVGSMNPEEGELRPQLLDRFGLCVDVVASVDPAERAEIVRRRLSFDAGESTADDEAVQRSLAAARPARIGDALILAAANLALAVGAEGLRADLVLCRAAGARAGLEGREEATLEDLRSVAPLVLAHRSRRSPFDPPMLSEQQLQRALSDVLDAEQPGEEQPGEEQSENDQPGDERGRNGGGGAPMSIGVDRRPPPVRPATIDGPRGRFVRDVAASDRPELPIALVPSVRRVAARRFASMENPASFGDPIAPGDAVSPDDLRAAVRRQTRGNLLVLVVDTSGSMGASERAELATGTVLGLLIDAYQRRDHVALVTFRNGDAELVLAPTGSVEVARNRLSSLVTGGDSPLAEGLRAALGVTSASTRRDADRNPVIVVLSDGRATGAPDALANAEAVAAQIGASGVTSLVLDCETGMPRLGLARRMAELMGATYVPAQTLSVAAVTAAIRSATKVAR